MVQLKLLTNAKNLSQLGHILTKNPNNYFLRNIKLSHH